MFVPAALKYRHEGEKDERKGDEGEQNVAGQEREINSREPAAKARRLFTGRDVIGDVADEKQGRGDDSCDHAGDVALPKISPDEIPAGGDKDRTDQIKRGIDRRQIGDGKHVEGLKR